MQDANHKISQRQSNWLAAARRCGLAETPCNPRQGSKLLHVDCLKWPVQQQSCLLSGVLPHVLVHQQQRQDCTRSPLDRGTCLRSSPLSTQQQSLARTARSRRRTAWQWRQAPGRSLSPCPRRSCTWEQGCSISRSSRLTLQHFLPALFAHAGVLAQALRLVLSIGSCRSGVAGDMHCLVIR